MKRSTSRTVLLALAPIVAVLLFWAGGVGRTFIKMLVAIGVSWIVAWILRAMGLVRWLNRLTALADDAMAERIIRSERVKRAAARVELFETKDEHLCLDPTCFNPVVGRAIYAHCERHLTEYERNWLREDVETNGTSKPVDWSEHPYTTQLRKMNEESTVKLIEQLALEKKQALDDARSLVARAAIEAKERSAWLPQGLQQRLGIDGRLL